MTKREAIKTFKESYYATLERGDYYEKQFAWACFKDMLCKDGKITMNQYENWDNPACIGKP
jgi:hypothetical protein